MSKLNIKLNNLIGEAWKIRQGNFESEIEFFKPIRTLPVSVTGAKCMLNCAHCNGQYLRSMVPIQNVWEEIKKRKSSSCLISGGCNSDGRVELYQYAELLKGIKEKCRINIHVGFTKKEEMNKIVELADVVSLDIPASDQIIREVYGLNLTRQDYIEEYKKLKDRVKTVPHICIGLEGNGIESELSVLDIMAEIKPKILNIIIFTPTKNTKYENRNAPDTDNVLLVIAAARVKLPGTKLILGCMRPRGTYREVLDSMAVIAGVNGVVMPSKAGIMKAEEYGLRAIWKEECCSL